MQNQSEKQNLSVILLAWTTTIFVSSLPNIIWQEFFGAPTIWLLWSKLILLGSMFALSFFWKPARSLRNYFLIFFILFLIEEIANLIGDTTYWKNWFPAHALFIRSMFGIQIRRVGVALIMTAVLFFIYKIPSRFFLSPGMLDSKASKEFFIIDEGTPWNRLGWILSILITSGTLAFLLLAGRPSLSQLSKALPLLPFVIILAAMNAFSEELNYRVAFLAPLFPNLGKTHSILLTATFFGLAHFYGVPYGVVGVIMSFVLGYLLSKSMIETRGFFWAWFIHFWQDVAIFSFMAIGSIIAGGG